MRLSSGRGEHRSWRLAVAVLGSFGALAFAAATAHAAYPGQNGKILFERGAKGSDGGYLSLVNPDGTGQEKLAFGGRVATEGSFDGSGSKIVFLRLGGLDLGGDPEVWVMNSDGSGQLPLTKDREYEFVPQLSPDGSKIAFRRGNDVWIMNSDGSGQTQIATFAQDPIFTPDGTRIIYDQIGGAPLASVGLDGSGKQELASGGLFEVDISPSGTALAGIDGVPNSGGSFSIFIQNPIGSSAIDLTHASGSSDGNAVFSPDGSQVLFNRSGTLQLISPAGANFHSIGVSAAQGGHGITLDWQPVTPATPQGPVNVARCLGKPATSISTTSQRDLIPDGGPGNDLIATLGGNDVIYDGQGKDRICAGPGKDRILVTDYKKADKPKRDIVDCGPGKDKVTADPADRLKHCETIKVKSAH